MTNFSVGSVYPTDTLINAKQNAIPLFATFELTPRCNMNCGMCYVHLKNSEISSHGRELTADEWIDLGTKAKQFGSLFLTITGGEPTLHPEFNKIYTALNEMGFIITLQSNLYDFSDDCFDLITNCPPQSIKFTMYGASDETYQKVCGVKDGFTKVRNDIFRLKEHGINLTAVTTVTKENINDLQHISDFMKENNIPWVSSTAIKKSGRNIDNHAEVFRIDDSCYCDLLNDVSRSVDKFKSKNSDKPCEICNEYRTGFWIKWDGKMGFCSFLNEPDIKVPDWGFEKSWKKLVEFEDNLQWPDKCKKCDIASLCPRCIALLVTESGCFNEVNEKFCNYIRDLIIEKRR